jgi:hypothetical protein
MRQWLDRLSRALRLDSELFEEVEHDYSAGAQALFTVLAASACGGAGNLTAAWIIGLRPNPWPSLIMMIAGFLVVWIVWSFVTMAIGTSIFGGSADMGEMQRALGFAAAPGLLMLIPGLGVLVGVPWAMMAMVVGVRQALDFDTRKAIGTVLLGALAMTFVVLPTGCWLHVHGIGRTPTATVAPLPGP